MKAQPSPYSARSKPCLFIAIAGSFIAALTTAQASVSLTGSSQYNPSTNDYTYMYSVQNFSATEDAVIVTLDVGMAAAIMGISAPSGFSLTYDSFVNVVNFAEDLSVVTPETFAPNTTVGGFSFTSPLAPAMSNYVAYDSSGAEFMGIVVAPVPEPSSAMLCGLAAGLFRRRRRGAA